MACKASLHSMHYVLVRIYLRILYLKSCARQLLISLNVHFLVSGCSVDVYCKLNVCVHSNLYFEIPTLHTAV